MSNATHRSTLTYRGDARHISLLPFSVPQLAQHVATLYFEAAAIHRASLSSRNDYAHSAGLPIAGPAVQSSYAHIAGLPIAGPAEQRSLQHIAPLADWRQRKHSATLRLAQHIEHRAALHFFAANSAPHRASLTYRLVALHRAPLPILLTNPGQKRHRAPLPITDVASRHIDTSVTLHADGLQIGMVNCLLAHTQGQAYASADIELASVDDYHRLPIVAPFVVNINGTEHHYIVDRRELTRDDQGRKRPAIRGLSACVLLDAPFVPGLDYTLTEATAARALVEQFLDGLPVDWELPDWIIPAYRLAVTGMTPLAIASRIAAAAGGVIEATPAGGVRVRPLHPVTVPAMQTTPQDADFAAVDDIYSVTESTSAARGIDRVRVYESAPDAAMSDRLEWIPDEDDGRTGIVRAYLSPWRETIRLRQTAGAAVSLERIGPVTKTVTDELIEIQAGSGNTSYPVVALHQADYQADNLGAITIEPNTTDIRTAVADYSLLQITYSTRSIDYRATASADLIAQLLIEDYTP